MENHTKIFSFTILDVYLLFGKVNGYFQESNGNNYLTLVPSNKSN